MAAVSADRLPDSAFFDSSSAGAPSAPSSVQGESPGSGAAGISQRTSDADLPAAAGAALDGLQQEGQQQQQPEPSSSQPLSPAESGRLMEALSVEMDVQELGAGAGMSDRGVAQTVAAAAATAALVPAEPPHEGQLDDAGAPPATPVGTAGPSKEDAEGAAGSAEVPSTGVAEAADAAAVAADMAELQAALPRIHTSPPTPTGSDAGAAGEATAEQFVAAAVEADARTAQLASLAEQSDLRGLERALDSLPQADPALSSIPHHKLARQDTPPDPRRWAARRSAEGPEGWSGERRS